MFGSIGLPELLIVLIPSILNGYLARTKGRSIVGWVVAGIIFNLLSTLVLVALKKVGKKA